MLTKEEIAARVGHDLYRPMTEIAAYEPSIEGITTGLSYIDKLTSGLRPKKLNLCGGYSGNGKTSLMLSTIVANPGMLSLFITSDDTDDLVQTKLIAMHAHMSTEDIEQAGAKWRIKYVEDNLQHVIIACPQKRSEYTTEDLLYLYDLVCTDFGEPPEFVGFDYLSLLSTSAERSDNQFGNVKAKAQGIKRVIRQTPDSVWLVGHQCVKAAGADCPFLTLNHLEYGGHQEADGVVIGCRRRLMTEKLSDGEMYEESTCPTTNVSVMKNKITGKTSANPKGVPYLIDPVSGIIREILDSDKPTRPGQQQVQAIRYPTLGGI